MKRFKIGAYTVYWKPLDRLLRKLYHYRFNVHVFRGRTRIYSNSVANNRPTTQASRKAIKRANDLPF